MECRTLFFPSTYSHVRPFRSHGTWFGSLEVWKFGSLIVVVVSVYYYPHAHLNKFWTSFFLEVWKFGSLFLTYGISVMSRRGGGRGLDCWRAIGKLPSPISGVCSRSDRKRSEKRRGRSEVPV